VVQGALKLVVCASQGCNMWRLELLLCCAWFGLNEIASVLWAWCGECTLHIAACLLAQPVALYSPRISRS
jgi:hypothetical protein